MRRLMFVAAVLFISAAFASSPGQPLDCSDWVWLLPGYTCVTRLSPPLCAGGECFSSLDQLGQSDVQIGADGRVYAVEQTFSGNVCGSEPLRRTRLVTFDGNEYAVVGFVDERCVDSLQSRRDSISFSDGVSTQSGAIDARGKYQLDNVRGVLTVGFDCLCRTRQYTGGNYCLVGDQYYVAWSAELRGFPSLYEITQTYHPDGAISTRVPAAPEGLPAADHFDTYYGPLTKPIDFAQAQPLKCDYPAMPPAPGDYLTVADPLPNPAVGTGRYYLTTVTYQRETRAGRKATNGELRGRDPAGIPACVQPQADTRCEVHPR